MQSDVLVIVVAWLLGAALVGVLAETWNRGGATWFGLSLLLSPLLALIGLVVTGRRPAG